MLIIWSFSERSTTGLILPFSVTFDVFLQEILTPEDFYNF